MKIYSYTPNSKRFLGEVSGFLKNPMTNVPFRLIEKINHCPYTIHLIDSDKFSENRQKTEKFSSIELVELHQAWSLLNDASVVNFDNLEQSGNLIFILGKPISHRNRRKSIYLFRFRGGQLKSQFFYLFHNQLTPLELINELRSVCDLWQIEEGRLPLHASGIIHKKGIYLFSGPSGTGKSTISRMSKRLGDSNIDHDQVMIYQLDERSYSANGWGYNLETSSLKIRAFFRIFQDSIDALAPLRKTKMTQLMWEQVLEVTRDQLPENYRKLLYERVADFSRSIPGYELHFRKSPDFWRLIDAEIPVE